jgi:hypothetical protein
MKNIKKTPILILFLMVSSFAIGFLGFVVLTSSEVAPFDTEAIDIGYKIREGHYGLDTNLEALPTGLNLPKSSPSPYYDIGAVIPWVGLNDYLGYYYLTYFELRAIGTTAEVWVSTNLLYPAGDPRNDPWYTEDDRYYYPEVTDEAILYLLGEFESNIIPTLHSVYGEADFHNGSNAILPYDYYEESGRNVILVSNIRDTAYYNDWYPYFIGGFFSSSLEAWCDRNIISIDSHQWYRRTGPEGTQWYSEVRDQLDPPVDRPHMYETLIAHEYQHLLHRDYNPNDPSFMNEACSMFAETLVGYPWETGDIESFLATPDNSLTEWGDQGGINILADYGASFLWALYLTDHFGGSEFLGHFVQAGIPGIEGVNAALAYFNIQKDFNEVFHDWRIANLIHSDVPGGGKYNYKSIDLGSLTQQARVYWADGEERGTDFGNTFTILGYDTGLSRMSSYGTDYIGFDHLRKLTVFLFNGDDEATFLGWEKTDGVWYSGMGDLVNTLIAVEVDVPATSPVLELTTEWLIEDYWDFGFVQVATDGVGDWYSVWTSLENAYTTYVHDPAAHPDIIANLPGLTGNSSGSHTITFDLSAYAGTTIHLGFRYMTDWAAGYPDGGWWISGLSVNGQDYFDGLNNAYPEVPLSFMVTIVEERTLPNGMTFYHIDDMRIWDGCNFGMDLAVLSKKEVAYLLVTPIMETGLGDYWFKVYSHKWC